MKKGITPMIAAIILIAFVVAIATIISGFFTDFAKQQKGKVEETGGETTSCGMGSIDLEENSIYQTTEGNVSVNAKNTGKVILNDLKLVVSDTTNKVYTYEAKPDSISPGEIKTVTTQANVTENITGGLVNILKVTVTTQCPGKTSSLINQSGSWTLSY
jgi:flagellin-like protein